jgi:hypothetical protein
MRCAEADCEELLPPLAAPDARRYLPGTSELPDSYDGDHLTMGGGGRHIVAPEDVPALPDR